MTSLLAQVKILGEELAGSVEAGHREEATTGLREAIGTPLRKFSAAMEVHSVAPPTLLPYRR